MTSHDVVARYDASPAPARSATPAPSTRWRRACSCSGSTGPPGCSATSCSPTRRTTPPSASASATTTDDAEGEVIATASTEGITEEEVLEPRWPAFVGDDRPGARRPCRRSRSTAGAPTTGCAPVSRSSWSRGRSASTRSRCTRSATPTSGVDLDVSVRCSSGTYIRAIARDLGARLGSRRSPDRAASYRGRSVRASHRAHPRAARGGAGAAPDRRRGQRRPSRRTTRRRAGRRRRLRSQAHARPRPSGPVALFAPDGDFLALYEQDGTEFGAGGRGLRLIRTPVVFTPCVSGVPWTTCPATSVATVVVIGNFDGVHLGHRHVVRRARELADRDGLPVVAVTFDPHPMAVLRPEHAPLTLTDIDRRVPAARAGRGRRRVRDPVLARDRGLDAGRVHRPRARRRRCTPPHVVVGRELPLRRPGRR